MHTLNLENTICYKSGQFLMIKDEDGNPANLEKLISESILKDTKELSDFTATIVVGIEIKERKMFVKSDCDIESEDDF